MDVVLEVLDVLNEMFAVLNSARVPISAPSQLIRELDRLADGGGAKELGLGAVQEAVTPEPETGGGTPRAGKSRQGKVVLSACPGGDDQERSVVIVHVGRHRLGFVVDQLGGQEEVVIKPLSAYLQGLPGFASATITGEGQIALILDVAGLMKNYAWVAA